MLAHDSRVQTPKQPRLAARLRLGARLWLRLLVRLPLGRILAGVGGGVRAPQLAARRTQEFFFAFWGSMRVKVEGPMRGKMVKVSALEALFMMVKVGRRPEILPWDYGFGS